MIQLQGLTKFYGRRRGVVLVDLEVGAGEIFGYLGPNGAGKTTTIRLLMGFIRPDRGRIVILGQDTLRTHRAGAEVHRRVGYLPGELALYEHLTVPELVRFFCRLRGHDSLPLARELAERLACPWPVRIASLSQGNKRKVGLILAMMHRPELLILDEPTGGLDPLVQQQIHGILRDDRAAGQTVFLSSHNLSEVEKMCDRVGIIRDGRIVAVERVTALQERSLRHVEIRFAPPAPPDDLLESLPNVQVISRDGLRLRCQVRGDIDPLVKSLSGFHVADLISQPPTLEEVFLAHYGESSHAS